jgi:hypothetical protein
MTRHIKEQIRVEEKWSIRNERYMHAMIALCRNKSSQHENAGYTFKKKNTYWGLPLVILPVIMSPVSLMVDSDKEVSKYINAVAFMITGIVGGVYSFFKFGEQMSNHFNFSARYADIVSDIELELVKGRDFRTQLDVFYTRIHMLVDNLSATEPVIPKGILDDKIYQLDEIKYSSLPQDTPDDQAVQLDEIKYSSIPQDGQKTPI